MINSSALYLTVFVHTEHFNALFICNRIAAACHNYAGSRTVVPFNVEVSKFFVNNCLANIDKVCFKSWKNYLRLRVTETSVILNYLRAVRSNHKSEIKTTLERSALCYHSVDCRNKDCVHTFLCNLVCIVRIRADCTHTACVKSLIIIVSSLVVF